MTVVNTVFLDIDGTLMDTNYLHVQAWAPGLRGGGGAPAKIEDPPPGGQGLRQADP